MTKSDYIQEHQQLHKEWTAAVGTDGYDKKFWQKKERELERRFQNWRQKEIEKDVAHIRLDSETRCYNPDCD